MILFLQKNSVLFERIECWYDPNGVYSFYKCDLKHISRKRYRIHTYANLSRPLRTAYVSSTAYRKYNTYQNFAGTLTDNVCDWLSGKSKSHFLDWAIKRVLNYTNLENRTCPLEGEVFIKADNLSTDYFPIEQFMPSGRYRLDLNFSETYRGKPYATAKLYGAISDHRIEQF